MEDSAELIEPSFRQQMTNDPAANVELKIGTTLSFQSRRVNFLGADQITYLENLSPTDGMVLAIFFGDDLEFSIDGSAVLVDAGVAFCAQHVFEHQVEALMQSKTRPLCVGYTETGLRLWVIQKITFIPNSDVAILGLAACSPFPSDKTYSFVEITTRYPSLGETVWMTGFRASRLRYEKQGALLKARASFLMCRGIVTQRYPNGRDSVMLPGPCIEVGCASVGGMSGGPVFDKDGFLIGIVSSSLSAEGDAGPSFVSLLNIAIAYKFKGGWPTSFFPNERRLLDSKSCCIQRPDAIREMSDIETRLPGVFVDLWEREDQLPGSGKKFDFWQ